MDRINVSLITISEFTKHKLKCFNGVILIYDITNEEWCQQIMDQIMQIIKSEHIEIAITVIGNNINKKSIDYVYQECEHDKKYCSICIYCSLYCSIKKYCSNQPNHVGHFNIDVKSSTFDNLHTPLGWLYGHSTYQTPVGIQRLN